MKTMRIRVIMLATVAMIGCLVMAAMLIIPTAPVLAEKKQGAKAGSSTGTCKVLSGPNKGKTGTYTEGGQWCEGSWGGTECKGSDGKSNGKCAAAAKAQAAPVTKATERFKSRG